MTTDVSGGEITSQVPNDQGLSSYVVILAA
jgi:hypothetical protein